MARRRKSKRNSARKPLRKNRAIKRVVIVKGKK